MLSRIYIKTDSISASVNKMTYDLTKFSNVRFGLGRLAGQIDPQIMGRQGIGSRMQNTIRAMSTLEQRMEALNRMIGFAVNEYVAADNKLVSKASPQGVSAQAAQGGIPTFTETKQSLWDAMMDWYEQNKNDVKVAWEGIKGAFKSGTPLASIFAGYRFAIAGNYVTVYGKKAMDSFFGKKYAQWRVPGTRYLKTNPAVAKFFNAGTAIKVGLSEGYAFWKLDNWKNIAKGRLLPVVTTTVANVWSYGFGEHKQEGIVSTGFASSMVVDTAIAVGTTVVSSAVASGVTSILATAGTYAAVGSVAPGVGTIAGLIVGVGVGVLLTTPTGEKAVNWTKAQVKSGLDWVAKQGKSAAGALSGMGNTIGNYLSTQRPIWPFRPVFGGGGAGGLW